MPRAKLYLMVLLGLLFVIPLAGQGELSSQKVLVRPFSPLPGTNRESSTEEKITQRLGQELGQQGFVVEVLSHELSLPVALKEAQEKKAHAVISGYYARNNRGELRLYGQIYSVPHQSVIDAFRVESLGEVLGKAGIVMEEVRTQDEESVTEITRRLALSLKANPLLRERNERLQENLFSVAELPKDEIPYGRKEKDQKVALDVFKLMAEKEETITIVSRRVGVEETASKAAAIVTVFNRRQIEQAGARNLADMLKLVPGVEVFYDQMGFYKVAFRGIRSRSGVLLLLDGQRINNFYDGSTFLDIRADVIEKIEIIRGPGSSVHGTNAFVGVINVVTRNPQPDKKLYADLSQRVGLYETFETSPFISSTMGDFQMAFHGHVYNSERQKFRINHDATCPKTTWDATQSCPLLTIPLPKNPDLYTNDRKLQVNVLSDFKYQNNYYLKVNFLHENRGPHVGELNTFTPDSELKMYFVMASLGIEQLSFGKFSLSSRLYSDFLRRDDSIQVGRSDRTTHAGRSPRKIITYDALTLGSEVLLQYDPIAELSLLLGTQYERLGILDYRQVQNYRATFLDNIFADFADYDAVPKEQVKNRDIIGLFLQAIYSPFSWLSLTTGVRYDRYSDFGHTINPKGGMVLEPLKSNRWGDVTLKLLYGQAFRAPTFQELYDKTQLFLNNGVYGNPNLKPETIRTAEAGLEYTTPYRPLRFLINGFYNRIYDNIEGFNTSSTLPTAEDKYRNLRGVETVGGESIVRLQWDARNYGYANVSLARSRDFGGFPPYQDKDVVTYRLDVPQLRANIAVNLGMLPFMDIFTSVQYSSFRAANYRYAFETMPDRRFRFKEYWLWNMSIASAPQFFGTTTLRITVYNVLNEPVFDDLNSAMSGFENRAFPKEGRYVEFRASLQLL
ncbi:MAG: TonB-dependent receptor [Leptospiraceae bacterium]|nr:TonB-dependent receptor [Leptospiraceae bacterium]MDW8307046.1 TonB-dependent receptor [Leptospiraceae bacterium]